MNDPIVILLGNWASELGTYSVLLRLALSVTFGALLGCERAGKRHAAGLRTFMCVSLACTVAMLLGQYLGTQLLAAAAIVGLAIITVNSVLFSARGRIKGLTTSVGLWACGAIGLAVGAGFYTVAIASFAALMCSLALFPHLEQFLKNRSNHFEIHVELKSPAYLQNFVTTVRELGMVIDDIESNPAYVHSGLSVYSIALSVRGKELRKFMTHAQIVDSLRTLEYVSYIEELN